jgi:putative hydrolase of the HAD superfamily
VPIRAVLFDFGGVLTESPFDAFADYERRVGLPEGFLRRLNAANHHDNAWARHERSEIDLDEFCALYEEEARAAGGEVDAMAVLACLRPALRPAMVEAVRRCHERLATALLTNNVLAMTEGDDGGMLALVEGLFDVVVESARVGVRKPDPRFYELALDQLRVGAADAVFLDDLGVNLKPARAMGMHTIKVTDADDAIAELESVVGFALRATDP